MLIDRGTVVLFLRLHDPPCADQLGICCNKVLANAVGSVLVPHDRVGDVVDAQPFHDFCGDDLVKRLLPERVAATFDEAALAVQNLPTLFQTAVRGVVR